MTHCRLGLGVGPNDVELVLRGLQTVALRYAAQDAATRRIAQWALGRKEFVRVLHPATPGLARPRALGRAMPRGGRACVTRGVRSGRSRRSASTRFVDDLRLFGIGWSWAGPMSLAVPYRPDSARVRGRAYEGTLVRLSIGLEDADDLIGDLEAALDGSACDGMKTARPTRLSRQSLDGPDTLCRISRPFSRSQSRSLIVLRLSWSALPLASAMSAFT